MDAAHLVATARPIVTRDEQRRVFVEAAHVGMAESLVVRRAPEPGHFRLQDESAGSMADRQFQCIGLACQT